MYHIDDTYLRLEQHYHGLHFNDFFSELIEPYHSLGLTITCSSFTHNFTNTLERYDYVRYDKNSTNDRKLCLYFIFLKNKNKYST